jgi:hypothetical protein
MKKCFVIFGFVFSGVVSGSELTPLPLWEKNNPNWNKDSSEITYLLGRCAANLYAVSGYFEQSKDSTAVKTAKTLKGKADEFAKMSMNVGVANGAQTEFLAKRVVGLIKIYAGMMEENKIKHNNIFTNNLSADVTFCNNFHSVLFENSR